MATYMTLKDIINSHGNTLPPQIQNSLLKTSGILQTGRWTPATHGAFDKVPVYTSLPTAGFKQINGSVVPATTTSLIKQADLVFAVASEDVDYDYINTYNGGIKAYLAARMPSMTAAVMNKLASQLYYGATAEGDTEGFEGLQATAIANSRYTQIDSSDDGTSDYTSMTAVKWGDSMSIVYDPASITSGTIVKFEVTGPVFLTTSTSTAARKKCYVIEAKAMIALRNADPTCLWSLVNIVSGESEPTYAQLRTMINNVRASMDDTIIYVSRGGADAINNALKFAKLQVGVTDMEFSAVVEKIDRIPVVLDENIKVTEDFVA